MRKAPFFHCDRREAEEETRVVGREGKEGPEVVSVWGALAKDMLESKMYSKLGRE